MKPSPTLRKKTSETAQNRQTKGGLVLTPVFLFNIKEINQEGNQKNNSSNKNKGRGSAWGGKKKTI